MTEANLVEAYGDSDDLRYAIVLLDRVNEGATITDAAGWTWNGMASASAQWQAGDNFVRVLCTAGSSVGGEVAYAGGPMPIAPGAQIVHA